MSMRDSFPQVVIKWSYKYHCSW